MFEAISYTLNNMYSFIEIRAWDLVIPNYLGTRQLPDGELLEVRKNMDSFKSAPEWGAVHRGEQDRGVIWRAASDVFS
jgi:hypothetical protein